MALGAITKDCLVVEINIRIVLHLFLSQGGVTPEGEAVVRILTISWHFAK